ncbi:hypothetical protein [Paraburkholderia steynii]|uniref:hypothetical protein n=1 Tax=Paraburkholderia steynii TaxID=1245441 RepID=UPI00141EF63F|nr:hypothetical protein [Paraburkholderia steynii]
MADEVFEQAKVDAVVQLVLTGSRQIKVSADEILCNVVRSACNPSSDLFVHVCANGSAGQNLRSGLDCFSTPDLSTF